MLDDNDLVYKVPGNCLCAINASAAFIYEDENLGMKLRKEMNIHIKKHSSYYINEGYCASPDVPF